MADLVLMLEIFDRLVAADLRRSRVYRDRCNLFDIDEIDFIQDFRLSKCAAFYVIEKLRPFLQSRSYVRTALSPEIKVLCALNFFGTGSYQRSVSRHSNIILSQASVSRSIKQVSKLICEKMMTEWIYFNVNRQFLTSLKVGFQRKFNFPGVIGCIDCTHIAIVTPKNEEYAPSYIYINRKGFHSKNVQLICDSDMKILNVIAKYPGNTHDSFIWKNSNIRQALMQFNEEGSWFLGDAGYPLEPWLLTPVSTPSNSAEESYNARHTATRNIIERVNGVLKNRFRCLLKARQLHYAPDTAGQIMNACCVLHNVCRYYNVVDPPITDEEDAWGPMVPQTPDPNLRRLGERIRRNLIATRFQQ